MLVDVNYAFFLVILSQDKICFNWLMKTGGKEDGGNELMHKPEAVDPKSVGDLMNNRCCKMHVQCHCQDWTK